MSYPWNEDLKFYPSEHLMKIERYDRIAQKRTATDYMNVQNRMMWFITDQRKMIVSGLAKCPYEIKTEIMELDREKGYAMFKTFIRDVLGNEVTMYGSETAQDFPDYQEKASTKSVGRALLLLGYGTTFATELDEGDRVVDAPQESRTQPAQQPDNVRQMPQKTNTQPANSTGVTMATDRQIASIQKLSKSLNQKEPEYPQLTYDQAKDILRQLSQAYTQVKSSGK